MLNLTVGTRPIPIPIPISIHKWRGQLNQKQLKCKAADNREGEREVGWRESGEYYYYICSCCCRGCCCDVDEVGRANDLYFFIEMSTCLLINVEPAYAEWETHLLIMRCMHKQQAGGRAGVWSGSSNRDRACTQREREVHQQQHRKSKTKMQWHFPVKEYMKGRQGKRREGERFLKNRCLPFEVRQSWSDQLWHSSLSIPWQWV